MDEQHGTDFLLTAGVMNCERRPVGEPPARRLRGSERGRTGAVEQEGAWARPGRPPRRVTVRSEGQQNQNAPRWATNNVSAVFRARRLTPAAEHRV
jgi:hypothetical protein